ncbi:inositol 2-dehydrogenase [Carnobacterium maltaromaticum]|uniref:inositol 2-dehydrogenase n=1 Tax=Carnobacterium maltaromaticum TaxID=2751 RepID=UPI001DF0AE06|nr:inositol 2-dehydrogenase [Carnobacterium maltaromaticum]MCC4311078.1 myo-inositol 2-dehydrogenase [Carnobacterium maltaromaticum]
MRTIKVGIVGLGRLGKIHAQNLAQNVPNCQLYAACSLNEEELIYAKTELGVEKGYANYAEMIADSELDAVAIASPSGYHCQQINAALEKGLHVYSEKPIGLDLEEIQATMDVINRHPKQIFMLGFMRRYDDSYRYAKELVEAGELGELTVVRCYGIDPSSGMESFVKFAGASNSGGLFADMSIHDIDLVRWFTKAEVAKVWAIGKNAAYPELDQVNELETGAAMLQLTDKTMGLLVAGRNCAHGYHVEMELIGTKGMLRIANFPEKNLVTVLNSNGVVRPCSQDFPERFAGAFITEMKEFIECILTEKQPEVTSYDGLQATKVALACKESFEKNQLIELK